MNHSDNYESTQTRDPACGMNVDPQSAKYKLKHDGHRYLFCSEHCLEEFRAHYARFAGGEVSQPLTKAEDRYTCPMHSKVARDRSGNCPK
jgi:Cu+-exporting ATPase